MKSHELYPAVTMHWNDFMAPHVHMCFQRVTYETKRPTHDLRMMADVEGGVVKPGKEVEWKEQIIVPALPQSSLAGCDLIKIEYYVKVRLITSSRLLDNCLIDTMSVCGMGCLPLHTNKLGRMSMRFRSEFMETLDLFPGEHLRSGSVQSSQVSPHQPSSSMSLLYSLDSLIWRVVQIVSAIKSRSLE